MNDELRKRLDDFRKRQASTANANAGIEAERARRKAAAAKAAATRAASTMAKAKAAREAAAAAAAGAAGGGAGPGPASAPPPGSTRDSLRTARRAVGVPLAKQLKDALDALMAARGAPVPAPALTASCGHDASPGSALAAALGGSAKVKTHAPPPGAPAPLCYAYVATHAARDKAGLVAAVAACPDGVKEADLADAYPEARADAVALVAAGALWSLPDAGGGNTLFAREVPPLVDPDPDVIAAWHEDAAPPADPAAFEAALKRAGIASAPRRLPARLWAGMAAARRARRGGGGGGAARAPRVTTNLHMPELFAPGGPTSIDG